MWRMTITVQRFLDSYAPDPDVRVPGRAFLEYAAANAPAELVELWTRHGLGFYGQQRLALVDPAQQPDSSRAWFGATLTIADEDDNQRVLTLVGDDEADAAARRRLAAMQDAERFWKLSRAD